MKKVIKNRVYDTNTATLIHSEASGDGFTLRFKELYRKRTGEYFFYQGGGANTEYRTELRGGDYGGSEFIVPTTPDKAKEWAQEVMEGDEYIAAFGLPDDAADEREVINVCVTGETKRKIDILRFRTGSTLAEVIDEVFKSVEV